MSKNDKQEQDKRRKAQAARVEEARAKMFAEREELKKRATKITAKMLKGVAYHEDYPVKLINGTVGLLQITPLAEGQIIQIFSEIGLDRLSALGESEQLDLKDYEFFWSVVSASSGLDQELIKKTFAVGESSIVGQRILEMSGFTAGAGEELENFPS